MFLSESAADEPAVHTFCEMVVGSRFQLSSKETWWWCYCSSTAPKQNWLQVFDHWRWSELLHFLNLKYEEMVALERALQVNAEKFYWVVHTNTFLPLWRQPVPLAEQHCALWWLCWNHGTMAGRFYSSSISPWILNAKSKTYFLFKFLAFIIWKTLSFGLCF